MDATQLRDILNQSIEIAMAAGNVLLRHFETPVEQQTKSSNIDLVTAADTASEQTIVAALSERYPDHHIVGEEGGSMGAAADSAHYHWYVDPLDGTTNFASRVPHFSVSIALTDAQRVPLVGVVYEPTRDELFAAYRGGGATLNGQPISVSQTEQLIQAVVVSGFGYDKATNPDNNLKQWGDFLVRTRGIRRFGSAALDFCYVAAGRFDGYWERSLNPWDALAGMLIVQEAGGRVTDYTGGASPQTGYDGRFLASNGLLHQAMLGVLALP